MALEGTLHDFSLADIFQLIGLQRKTGVLTLHSKDDTVTVTFLDGKVVGADSLNHRLENRLGNVLIKSGVLTADQLGRALEIQKETLKTTLVKLKERLSEVEEDDWQARNEPEESRGEEAELTQAAIDEIEGSIEDGLGDDFPTLLCHFTIFRETHLDRLKVAQIREHYATKPEWIARMDEAQLMDEK